MAAIRQAIQREIFQPEDERIVSLTHVIRGSKKAQFLCLTISAEPPIAVKLHLVKYEQGTSKPKKKQSWSLRDLMLVDGKNPRKNNAYFELTLDGKVYGWEAVSYTDKESFIKELRTLFNKYLPVQKPEFINVSLPVEELEFGSLISGGLPSIFVGHTSPIQEDLDQCHEDYQPLSVKEEQDFRRTMEKVNLTIGQADQFSDVLSKQLSMLDDLNIGAILTCDQQVEDLMNMIDKAMDYATELEKRLNGYDHLMENVREAVEQMEERDSLVHKQANNRKKLLDELSTFVVALDFPRQFERDLMDPDLSDLVSISRTTKAANALQKCLAAKLSPGMDKMKATTEQKSKLKKLSDSLAEKFAAQLSSLFNRLAELSPKGDALSLPKHSNAFNALNPYLELMLWLKTARPDAHKIVIDRYKNCFSRIYDGELATFFSALKQNVQPVLGDRKASMRKSLSSGERLNLRLPASDSSSRLYAAGGCELDASAFKDKSNFEKLIEKMLAELEPAVAAEQKFCVKFFHLNAELSNSDTISVGSTDSGGLSPEKRLERKAQEEINELVGGLLRSLEPQLVEFMNHCDRVNPFFNMHLMAMLYRNVAATQNSSAFMSVMLGKMVIITKRRFDSYMESRIQEWKDLKLTKRVKLGVLPFLLQFQELATEAEAAFGLSERRNDIDRWYGQLVAAICQTIQRISEDLNSKSPSSVVLMESYHRLFSILSHLKIACLETQKKEAKACYQEHLRAYVSEYMGKPLDKISVFFDNVEHAIQQGLKPEEVGYQMAFNKQELRKLVKDYAGKDVRRGLDQLYKKVEKHLCEEENLLQVVWHEMQNEFINQYKRYELLMAQCYPNSAVGFEFTIEDILSYFSDIAQQH